jgi:hypothetical protein
MTNDFPEVKWVTTLHGDFIDYRPAIGPDGDTIVFERTIDKSTMLYVRKISIVENATEFLSGVGDQQTRPDWNWAENSIVLNIVEEGRISIYTISVADMIHKHINNTRAMIYPQWVHLKGEKNGAPFVVMNQRSSKGPVSTLIAHSGEERIPNLNGKDKHGKEMFGGMPAVFPGQEKLIAYAGQPDSIHWHGKTEYTQDFNYIFLNGVDDKGNFVSHPMEKMKQSEKYEQRFQGRAPVISPDGNYIAFESNRIDGTRDGYALYLFNRLKPECKPKQLTDPCTTKYAQHPKFFPDGKSLVFTAIKPDVGSRVAYIDISGHL